MRPKHFHLQLMLHFLQLVLARQLHGVPVNLQKIISIDKHLKHVIRHKTPLHHRRQNATVVPCLFQKICPAVVSPGIPVLSEFGLLLNKPVIVERPPLQALELVMFLRVVPVHPSLLPL